MKTLLALCLYLPDIAVSLAQSLLQTCVLRNFSVCFLTPATPSTLHLAHSCASAHIPQQHPWSRHASLNDPDTNACGYKGLSGQPRGPSWDQRRPSPQGPVAAPDRRLPSAQQASGIFDGVEDLLEAERPTSPFGGSGAAGTAAGIDDDLFRFREKGAIAGTERRREVERRRRGPAGGSGGRGGGGGGGSVGGERSAVKVELATQLGVPATSTYEEVRDESRVVACCWNGVFLVVLVVSYVRRNN